MRQKSITIEGMKNYSLGEILALTLRDLRKTQWEETQRVLFAEAVVLGDYRFAISTILSFGVNYLNQSCGTSYDCFLQGGCTIIKDPNSALTPAQLADALPEYINRFIRDTCDSLVRVTFCNAQSLPEHDDVFVIRDLKRYLAENPSLVVIELPKMFSNGAHSSRELDTSSVLDFLIKKFNLENMKRFHTRGEHAHQRNCYLAIQPSDITALKDLLLQEINDINPEHLNPPVSLQDHCLNWLSQSANYSAFFTHSPIHRDLPSFAERDIGNCFFIPLNYWDDLKPYAGKIILYKSQRALFYRENETAFLLYPEYPDIRVGIIAAEEFRKQMEIGFRISLFALTNNFNPRSMGSPNPLLSTSQVRFGDIGVRVPTLAELQVIRDTTGNRIAAFFATAKGNHHDDWEAMRPVMNAAEQDPVTFLTSTCEKTLQLIDAEIALTTSVTPPAL